MTTGIAASQLANMSEEQLYSHLGAINKEARGASLRSMALNKNAESVSAQDDSAVGKSFFQRLNKQAKEFFCGGCGESGDLDCLEHLKTALGLTKVLDPATMITAVSALFVAQLGWGAVVAGVVAAILVKFVFPGAAENICAIWKVA